MVLLPLLALLFADADGLEEAIALLERTVGK